MQFLRSVPIAIILCNAHIFEESAAVATGELFLNVSETNYTTIYGTPVSIECNIIPNPDFGTVHVFWLKIVNEELIYLNTGYPGTEGMTMTEPSLTIIRPTFDDIGIYFCSAKDHLTNATSPAIHLNVIGDIPRVDILHKTQNVACGKRISLICNVTSIPTHYTVYWQRLSNGSTANITYMTPGIDGITNNSPSLTILKANPTDSGQYTCIAVNIVGLGRSDVIDLTVFEDFPNVQITSATTSVEYGQPFTLECKITSCSSQYLVYWQRTNNETTSNITSDYPGITGITIKIPSITILKAVSADSGQYKCFAANNVGTGYSDAIHVTVIGGIPSVIVDRKNDSVEYGQNITLECSVDSIPTFTHIYWKKKSNGTTKNITFETQSMNGVTVTKVPLTIVDSVPADSGIYTCYAENIAGIGHSDSLHLNVYGGIPAVTADTDSLDIQYGHNHTIRCNISSVPVHTKVYWQKLSNGTTINITAGSYGFDGATLTNPSLTILKANSNHSGEYVCYAFNIAGGGRSSSINLTVVGSDNYPIVLIESKSYTVRYLDSITIKSFVLQNEEYPVRNIYWQYVNNGVLTTIEFGTEGMVGSSITMPSLTIETVTTSESGLYTCFATNDVGTGKSLAVNVTVIGGLPTVNVPDKAYTTWYGEHVTCMCDVTADPPAKFVYWEKIVNETKTVINSGIIGVQGVTPSNPSLTLEYTTNADSGVYRCFATNDVGTGHSDIVTLQVMGEKPSVHTSVDTVSVKFGDKAILTCHADTHLPVNVVYWEKDINGAVTRINPGTIGTKGISLLNPSLTILYATTMDSGLYTCFVGNVVGKGQSLPVKFTVIGGLPEVSISAFDYNTIYGKEIKIECKIKAFPPVTLVYWQRNISNIVSMLNEGTIGTKGINITMPSLILTFPTTEDSGSYTCFAANSAGTQKSLPATLLVEGDIPVVAIRSQQYIAHFGDSVTLECDINAVPSHTNVFWYRTVNGFTTVIANGYTGTLGISLQTPSLTILFAAPAETGIYTCLARNAAGIGKSQPTHLNVLAGIPEVIVPSKTYMTGVDYAVTLVCLVKKASPEISKIYWQRYINNATTVITSGSTGVDGVTVENPSLTILSAKVSMSGEYTCFAINSVGTGSSFPTLLTVEHGRVERHASATNDSKAGLAAAISSGILACCAVVTIVVKVYRYKTKRDLKKLQSESSYEESSSRKIDWQDVSPGTHLEVITLRNVYHQANKEPRTNNTNTAAPDDVHSRESEFDDIFTC